MLVALLCGCRPRIEIKLASQAPPPTETKVEEEKPLPTGKWFCSFGERARDGAPTAVIVCSPLEAMCTDIQTFARENSGLTGVKNVTTCKPVDVVQQAEAPGSNPGK